MSLSVKPPECDTVEIELGPHGRHGIVKVNGVRIRNVNKITIESSATDATRVVISLIGVNVTGIVHDTEVEVEL